MGDLVTLGIEPISEAKSFHIKAGKIIFKQNQGLTRIVTVGAGGTAGSIPTIPAVSLPRPMSRTFLETD